MTAVTQSNGPLALGLAQGFGSQNGDTLANAIANMDVRSPANGQAASTTQTRLGGLADNMPFMNVSSANASDAITLAPQGGLTAALPGTTWIVKNTSGVTIQIFPPGASDTIDGGSAGASVNLGNGKLGVFVVGNAAGGVLTIYSGAMAASS